MNKKRKSLDDSLASEFVFGGKKPEAETGIPEEVTEETTAVESETTPIASMPEKPVENKSQELSFMEKLQVEAKEGTKRFTIDLRESVHRKLSILSAKTGRSKADIIRMVLDDVLKDVEE
jgi:fructose-1,6-bisphosphatase/sedoheptulose 1,7-bisphosphatase-like protein